MRDLNDVIIINYELLQWSQAFKFYTTDILDIVEW